MANLDNLAKYILVNFSTTSKPEGKGFLKIKEDNLNWLSSYILISRQYIEGEFPKLFPWYQENPKAELIQL